MPGEPRRSLMFNLGAFFGNLARTVRADGASPPPAPGSPQRRIVSEDVHEEVRDTPQGTVTLRRTTIEEIEVQPPRPSAPPPPASPPPR